MVISLGALELIRWSLKRGWVLLETNHSKHEGHVPDFLRIANCHSVWETHKRAWAWPLGAESDLWLPWAEQPTYWHQAVVKESTEFIAGCQARRVEKAMAPHSSTLAWKIPWTEEPGGLQSMGSRRVGHNWVTSLSFFTFMHWRRKWQPTPVFLPGESQGRGSLVGCCLWGRTESDTPEAT